MKIEGVKQYFKKFGTLLILYKIQFIILRIPDNTVNFYFYFTGGVIRNDLY